jgi:chromosomal replication initiation ATPase DnaA
MGKRFTEGGSGLTVGRGASACEFIKCLVAGVLSIDLRQLRAERRGRADVAFARQAAMYLAHVHLGLSLTRVGAHFGRDRTTAAHACAVVEEVRDDAKLGRVLECLEAALDRWREVFLRSEAT